MTVKVLLRKTFLDYYHLLPGIVQLTASPPFKELLTGYLFPFLPPFFERSNSIRRMALQFIF